MLQKGSFGKSRRSVLAQWGFFGGFVCLWGLFVCFLTMSGLLYKCLNALFYFPGA